MISERIVNVGELLGGLTKIVLISWDGKMEEVYFYDCLEDDFLAKDVRITVREIGYRQRKMVEQIIESDVKMHKKKTSGVSDSYVAHAIRRSGRNVTRMIKRYEKKKASVETPIS